VKDRERESARKSERAIEPEKESERERDTPWLGVSVKTSESG